MFNDIIVRHFTDPRFAGTLNATTATIELGNPVCGDRIRVQMQVADGVVRQARFQAWGCATSLAVGNLFCESVDGRPLTELLSTPARRIDASLGELEPSQHHCLEMLHALFCQLSSGMPSTCQEPT